MGKRVLLAVNTRARRGRGSLDRVASALRSRGHEVVALPPEALRDGLSAAIVARRDDAWNRAFGAPNLAAVGVAVIVPRRARRIVRLEVAQRRAGRRDRPQRDERRNDARQCSEQREAPRDAN